MECTLAQIDLRIMLDRRHDAVVIFCLIGITVATRSPAESGALFLRWLCGEEPLCLVRWWAPNQLLSTGC